MGQVVLVDGESLTLDESLAVGYGISTVALKDGVKEKIDQNRLSIMNYADQFPVYGFTRGFGQHQNQSVPQKNQQQLQQNLIRSHALAFVDYFPIEVVRMALLFRINSFEWVIMPPILIDSF